MDAKQRVFAAVLGPVVAASLIAVAMPLEASAGPSNGLQSYYTQVINWAPCDTSWVSPATGVDCATLIVPLDYRNPDGEQIEIALARKQAADPQRRRGILMTNPGGPGGTGLRLVHWFNGQEASQVYDIIGMDPRGVGKSTQLSCYQTSLPFDYTSRPPDDELPMWTAWARAEEDNCQRAGGEMRRHVNTMNTARDMDVIRGALGEEKINYVGYSYGTHLGAVYGSLFPSRLDRSVLDSALDPNKTWHESDPDVVHAIRANVRSWSEWVAARDSVFGLGRGPAEVRAVLEVIAGRLKNKPVSGFSSLTQFDSAVGFNARYRRLWAAFGRTIRQVRDEIASGGHSEALAAENAAMVELVRQSQIEPTSPGTYSAVTCEWDWVTDINTYYQDMRLYREVMPYGWAVSYLAPTNCTFRGFQRLELLPTITRKYPTGLVIQSEGDIQTPLINGVAMAETLGDHLVLVPNDGQHGHYALRGNACVDRAANRYLVHGILPGSRTSCEATDRTENIPADGTVGAASQAAEPASAIARRIVAEIQSHPVY